MAERRRPKRVPAGRPTTGARSIPNQPRAKPNAGFKLCRTETKKEAEPQALKVSTLRELRASLSPFWKTAESAAKCGRARAPEKKGSHGVHGVHGGFLAVDISIVLRDE